MRIVNGYGFNLEDIKYSLFHQKKFKLLYSIVKGLVINGGLMDYADEFTNQTDSSLASKLTYDVIDGHDLDLTSGVIDSHDIDEYIYFPNVPMYSDVRYSKEQLNDVLIDFLVFVLKEDYKDSILANKEGNDTEFKVELQALQQDLKTKNLDPYFMDYYDCQED